MKFSNTTYAFYPEILHNLYEENDNLPEDLIDVPDEDFVKFLNGDYGPLVEYKDGELRTRCVVIEKTLTQEEIDSLSTSVRDSYINKDISFAGVFFQVPNDCTDIKSALQEASLLGLEDSYTQSWRLSDNTWRDTTIAEAKQIVQLFVLRKQEVWKQFKEWSEGDKTSIFEYKESKYDYKNK